MKSRAVDEYSGVAVQVSAAATATTTAMLATMVPPPSPQDDPVILELHPSPDSRDPSERRNPNRRFLVDCIADTFSRVKRIRAAGRRVSVGGEAIAGARTERRSWGSLDLAARASPRCGDAARSLLITFDVLVWMGGGCRRGAAALSRAEADPPWGSVLVMAACLGVALHRPRHADQAARGARAHRQLRRDAAARVGRGAQRCGGLRRPTSSAPTWPAACPAIATLCFVVLALWGRALWRRLVERVAVRRAAVGRVGRAPGRAPVRRPAS